MCPSNSKVLTRGFMPDDIFDDVRTKLAKYSEQGSLLLLGDLNSRTQTLSDVFPEDIPYDQDPDYRNSQDHGNISQYGRKFIGLCKEVPLRSLNGRFLGDLLGNFTCSK